MNANAKGRGARGDVRDLKSQMQRRTVESEMLRGSIWPRILPAAAVECEGQIVECLPWLVECFAMNGTRSEVCGQFIGDIVERQCCRWDAVAPWDKGIRAPENWVVDVFGMRQWGP